MKKLILLSILSLSAFSTSYAAPKTVDVSYNIIHADMGSATHIYVLSLENNVTIKGISVNRGNCRLFRGEFGGISEESKNLSFMAHLYGNEPTFPVHLKYGQSTYFIYNNCPNVLEVTITTDTGKETFNF